jgi:hypothetical protein
MAYMPYATAYQWALLSCLLALTSTSTGAFTQNCVRQQTRPHPRCSDRHLLCRRMVVDPHVIHGVAMDLLQQHLPPVDVLTTGGHSTTATASALGWETMLSTLYTAHADVMLTPAHEHTQSFWGPPDPYLTAGKSIAPSARALLDMGGGMEQATATTTTTSAAGLSVHAQAALSKGWKLLDAQAIKAENTVWPGFSPTSGFLPPHDPRVPAETPETFAAQVEWSAQFLNVVDKLPSAAFWYALLEFFLLRPGLDLYKEDIDEGSTKILSETIVTTGIRMGVFCVVAIVTTGIFG